MKKISIILLTAVASFFFAPVASAQTINETIKDTDGSTLEFPNATGVQVDDVNKVAYSKNISKPFSDGTYWIKLETFATGTAEKVVTSTPSDIILVLDLSSSMYSEYYTYKGTRMRRIEALRLVIEDFAKTVYDNDANARSKDSNYAGDRIAIIGYDRSGMMKSDNWVYINDATNGVQKDAEGVYSGGLINVIQGLESGHGTRPDHGLEMAIEELLSNGQAKREEANLTVLLFTDGYPTDEAGSGYGDANQGTQSVDHFDYPFASKALYYASRLKKEFDAKLFSVGLITSITRPGNPNQNNQWQYRNYCRVLQMMDWISSNYPDAAFNPESIGSLAIEDGTYKNRTSSTVYTGNNVPTPWRNAWTFTAGADQDADAISLADFIPGDTDTDGNKFTNDGNYCQIVDDSTDFSDIFEAISKQTAGTANESLSPQASNLDMISNSFILPDDVNAGNVKTKIKIFTQKLTSMTGDGTQGSHYVFGEDEILADNNDFEYPVYNSYGVQTGTKDIDEDINVELVGTNGIKVTGFDYAANFCGKVTIGNTEEIQGWKIIIMIPIKMNPDAVGGPNVPTNGPGSGIYPEGSTTPLVEFNSPAVSLPVNVYIEKIGLQARESAKFTIERAYLPASGNIEDVPTSGEGSWEYVSTVFVTNSPNSSFTNLDADGNLTANSNPMVRVKGMPATKVLGWKNEAGEMVTEKDATHTIPVQQALVYRIYEEPWSWSYTPMTDPQYTITEKIDNPFTFTNSKRTDDNIDVTVRHAESKVMNVFKGGNTVGTDILYDDSKKNVGRENYWEPPTKPTNTSGEGGNNGGE
ncbi:MAG: VWA domain-containing protein [Bacteroidales bacterium]|nr:VWA domain-containing protein [Bacteroidales bacterium]